jgi:hypothetical protein
MQKQKKVPVKISIMGLFSIQLDLTLSQIIYLIIAIIAIVVIAIVFIKPRTIMRWISQHKNHSNEAAIP